MVHKFPFTALHFTLDSNKLDVNVHPTKMEFKYADGEQLFDFVKDSVRQALLSEEMIQDVSLKSAEEERAITIERQRSSTSHVPEPFEKEARAMRYQQGITRYQQEQKKSEPPAAVKEADGQKFFTEKTTTFPDKQSISIKAPGAPSEPDSAKPEPLTKSVETPDAPSETGNAKPEPLAKSVETPGTPSEPDSVKPEQLTMPVEQFLSEEARKKHRLIGQVFKTYWLIEYEDKLYIVDQHAAHEKVMFERLMRQLSKKQVLSQQLLPAKVLHLDSVEHNTVIEHMELFSQTGFDIEDFGDDSIVVRAVPDDIMGVEPQLLFDELLNALTEERGTISLDFFVEKLSGMACKAAIKGNTEITTMEADRLIDEMLSLDNPYNCPHGRPTMIALTKVELEHKFKRIQD